MYAVGLVICIIVILLTYQTNDREKSDMDVIRTYNTIHNEKRYMDWVSSVQNKQKRNILEIDPGLDEINNNTSTYAFKIDDKDLLGLSITNGYDNKDNTDCAAVNYASYDFNNSAYDNMKTGCISIIDKVSNSIDDTNLMVGKELFAQINKRCT